jgi:hypothetical protein
MTIIPGAKPNDTMSAKESSCFPSSLWIASFLATKPSKKSNPIAANKNKGETSILPASVAIIEIIPQTKFIAVSKFGRLNISGSFFFEKKIFLKLHINKVYLSQLFIDVQITQFFGNIWVN